MVEHTSPEAAAQHAKAASSVTYSKFEAIGWSSLHPMELQSRTLHAVMQNLERLEDYEYLGQHAFPVCLPPFLEYVQTSMDRYAQIVKVVRDLPDTRPYLDMLGSTLSCMHTCYLRYLTLGF